MGGLLKAVKAGGTQEAMPPLPMCNKLLGIWTQFKVVNIAEAEPTGTQLDTAYSNRIFRK